MDPHCLRSCLVPQGEGQAAFPCSPLLLLPEQDCQSSSTASCCQFLRALFLSFLAHFLSVATDSLGPSHPPAIFFLPRLFLLRLLHEPLFLSLCLQCWHFQGFGEEGLLFLPLRSEAVEGPVANMFLENYYPCRRFKGRLKCKHKMSDCPLKAFSKGNT